MTKKAKRNLARQISKQGDSSAITRVNQTVGRIMDKVDFPLVHKFHHVGGHIYKVDHVSLSDDAKYLTTSSSNNICVWDVKNATCLDSFMHDGSISFIDFWGHSMVISSNNCGERSTSLWGIAKENKKLRTIPAQTFCLSSCKRYAFLLVTNIHRNEKLIELHELETGKIVKKIPAPSFNFRDMDTDDNGRFSLRWLII